MITYVGPGDLFNTPCQTAVVTVNCVGVMGKGLALGAALLYPGVVNNYRKQCKRGNLKPGKMLFYPIGDDKKLLLFPTKVTWQNDSELEWIELGLAKLVSQYQERDITSLALPLLGCTNGNLDATIVQKMIVEFLDPISIPVHLYTGRGKPVVKL